MKLQANESYLLGNFDGPLDLLWHLINRQEIDIYEISLQEITQQYLARYQEAAAKCLDGGAEFIAAAASLVWLKSKTLLPTYEQPFDSIEEEEHDPHFDIIHQLLDYCRFKQAAKSLSEREQHQSAFYFRGTDNELEIKKKLGIDHLTIDDLALLFKDVLSKAPAFNKGLIYEETWRVSNKIKTLRYLLKEHSQIPFHDLFSSERSREELIVTFLALLELMKGGEAKVIRDLSLNTICITNPVRNTHHG